MQLTVEELNNKILSRDKDIRIGQALFNALADHEISGMKQCVGTGWDPYYVMMDMTEYAAWMMQHVVIIDNSIVEVRE